MIPQILVVYKDHGGASALRPVVQQLLLGGRVSIAMQETPDPVAMVLTGTSSGARGPEKQAIAWARERGIPSLSVLDFWVNYRERFNDERGELAYLPDRIAVMDAHARDEMIALGFPKKHLVITGQPAFDCLSGKRLFFGDKSLYFARVYYNFRHGRRTAVFVSQPHSQQPYNYGYNEHTVLPLIIDAARKLDIDLIIRPHPREDICDLVRYEDMPQIQVRRAGLVHELLMAADLVIGMNTELLVEACYLGCDVLSVQPGLVGHDCLPTNRMGVSQPVYHADNLLPTMRSMLEDAHFCEKRRELLDDFVIGETAAPKVVRLVYDMIGVKEYA